MSYETGTANGFMDWLDKLDAFLCNQGHAWGKTYTGTGNGTLTSCAGKSGSVAEMITITATGATTFSVVGSVTGSLGTATVGTPFTSSRVDFLLTAGSTAFVAGDVFTLQTSPKWTQMRYAGAISPSYRSGTNWDSVYPYTRAFDDTSNTVARSLGVPAYIAVEMHKAVAVTTFNLSCGDSSSITPKDITLQWSDDGAAWNDHQSWTSLTWTTVFERKTFSVTSPASHKFWRLAFTAAQSSQTTVRIGELELFSAPTNEWQLEDRFEFCWRAPGLDGSREIFVGGHTYQVQASNIHNLCFYGCRFWDATKSVSNQQNNSGLKVMALNNQPFAYHFVANGQRVIAVGIPGGAWELGYFGFGLPYEPPSAHPFPHIMGASGDDQDLLASDVDGDHRAPFAPGPNGLAAYFPDNAWRQFANRATGTGSDGGSESTSGKVFPWAFTQSGTFLNFIRDQIDGGFSIIPATLIYNISGVSHVFGELDGLYFVSGFNNSAGTTLSVDGCQYLIVKNITRSNAYDFAALLLD